MWNTQHTNDADERSASEYTRWLEAEMRRLEADLAEMQRKLDSDARREVLAALDEEDDE